MVGLAASLWNVADSSPLTRTDGFALCHHRLLGCDRKNNGNFTYHEGVTTRKRIIAAYLLGVRLQITKKQVQLFEECIHMSWDKSLENRMGRLPWEFHCRSGGTFVVHCFRGVIISQTDGI